jgi:hypothetical protein
VGRAGSTTTPQPSTPPARRSASSASPAGVQRGVRRAARGVDALVDLDDGHRGLARELGGGAVEEAVEHRVAEHDDVEPREALGEPGQAVPAGGGGLGVEGHGSCIPARREDGCRSPPLDLQHG